MSIQFTVFTRDLAAASHFKMERTIASVFRCKHPSAYSAESRNRASLLNFIEVTQGIE